MNAKIKIHGIEREYTTDVKAEDGLFWVWIGFPKAETLIELLQATKGAFKDCCLVIDPNRVEYLKFV